VNRIRMIVKIAILARTCVFSNIIVIGGLRVL